MDQKEIEEKLKNFQVKHIEKPEKKEEQPLSDHEGFCEQWKHAAKILIGIGGEWKKSKREDICEAYDLLAKCLEGRDYFIVTTNTDAEIFRSRLDASRITAPCGNETWRQCSRSCTKDIWEPGEIPDDICPHCGAPLCGNTIVRFLYRGRISASVDGIYQMADRNREPAVAGTGAGRRL